jgi:mannose-1-phosphate guanylyltransferase
MGDLTPLPTKNDQETVIMKSNYVIIMAGGVGSRFWPASRESRPKQFLDILGIGKSLIRLTYERFLKIVPSEHIYVITNEKYRSLVAEHLPELGDHQIVGEPSRNNTAPCVAYAAFKLQSIDKNANLLVSPSDHYIHDEAEFVRVVKAGFDFTEAQAAILTMGMKPTRPDIGYGYIELGEKESDNQDIYKAQRFTEKPDAGTAQQFLEHGHYVWNSGMFFFKARTILADFKEHAPDIYNLLLPTNNEYNTVAENDFIRRQYPQTPSISIDYAIMEKAAHIYCLRADFGWSDLGAWGSLYDFKEKDAQANVLLGGKLLPSAASGNLVSTSAEKTIILKDVHDFFIVDTDDILLIWPKKDEGGITEIRKSFE